MFSPLRFTLLLSASLCLLSACTISDGVPVQSEQTQKGGFQTPVPRLYPGEVEALLDQIAGEEAKTWQLVSRHENGEAVPVGCHVDDRLVIWRRNLITFDSGEIKCGPDDGTQQLSWRLTDQHSLLILTSEGAPFELVILEASDQQLVLENRQIPDLLIQESYVPLDLGPETPSSQGPLAPLRPSLP